MKKNNAKQKFLSPKKLLGYLNETFNRTHTAYEKAFWISNMGDHSVDKKMNTAQGKRYSFRANVSLNETLTPDRFELKPPEGFEVTHLADAPEDKKP